MASARPDALLLLAPGCPHCPGMLRALADLLEAGRLGALEAVSIAAHPERAAALAVRSVPFVMLGPLELEGARSPGELRRWAEQADDPAGLRRYLREELEAGRLHRVAHAAEHHAPLLDAALELVADPQLALTVRIGLSALLEGFAGPRGLAARVGALAALLGHDDRRVRTDAAHLLGLSASSDALAPLQAALQDPEAEVRESVAEALENLHAARP